jgi:hypothetical protein
MIQVFENGQRLAVVALGLEHLPRVGLPIAHPIQALGEAHRIAYPARQLQRALHVLARPRVVTRRPEQAEIEQRLPLGALVSGRLSQRQRRFMAGLRLGKIAQQLEGSGKPAMDLQRRRGCKLVRRLERAREVLGRGPRRVQRQGSLPGPPGVPQRLVPRAGRIRVVGQVRQVHLVGRVTTAASQTSGTSAGCSTEREDWAIAASMIARPSKTPGRARREPPVRAGVGERARYSLADDLGRRRVRSVAPRPGLGWTRGD